MPFRVNPSIAIKNVCAWPNLAGLPSGELLAVIFNQPSHGLDEGSLECWHSPDGGKAWFKKGVAAPHEGGKNRMHCAFGIDRKGNPIVLSTGFELVDGKLGPLEGMWFSRSMDEGRNWTVNKTPGLPGGQPLMIPYGKLNAAAYLSEGKGRPSRTWFLQSDDDGESWSILSQIGNGDTNETALLRLSDNLWLAAARTHVDHHVELYRSDDGGKSWRQSGPLTLPMQHPADLMLLPNGVILLTFGLRNRGLFGIGGRISENQGLTWSAPFVLTQFGDAADCGYPSSIRTEDGGLVTAYYSDRVGDYSGYHMGILRWRLEEFTRPRLLKSISDHRRMEI